MPFTIANNMKLSYVDHYSADFETCFDNENRTDVRVWAWGLGNIFDENDYLEGTTIDTFMGHLLASKNVQDIGFHNLKFDGPFIIAHLYKLGFEYINNTTFIEKWKAGEDLSKTFTHNITTMGQWFSITIVKDGLSASSNTPSFIHIWDTLKLFPQTLKEVGKQYNKKHHKIEVEEEFYDLIRPIGHKLNEEESLYLKEDVLTLAEALKIQIDLYGTLHRTRAAKAFSFFKASCTTENGRSNVYQLHYEGVKEQIIPHVEGIEEWEGKLFRYAPVSIKNKVRASKHKKLEEVIDYYIEDHETWMFCKRAYSGGISFVEPAYTEMSIEQPICVLDENSMYPHKMKEKKVPYGRIFKHQGRPNTKKYPAWIACARVSFQVKKPYNLPCIQMKAKYGRQWLRESTDYMDLGHASQFNNDLIWFTSVDYETYKKNYNFKVWEWVEYYGFKTWSNEDGARFVDRFYAQKQAADHILRDLKAKYSSEELAHNDEYLKACLDRLEAKVIMNSAYGKHGTKYVLLSKNSQYIDDETPIQYKSEEDNFSKEPDDPSHYYCPYAAFITAYARQDLVEMWNSLEGRALYCDTDSVHFLGTMDDIPESMSHRVDWEKTGDIGLWKHEGDFVRARYIRSKAYIEVEANGKEHVTCAGAPPEIKKLMDWQTFRVGFNAWEIADKRGLDREKYSKLKPKSYPSGVALEGQNFEIRPK